MLGIEPASNIAKIATKNGIPTLEKFFNTDCANELKEKNQQADLLLGNNVLAHVPNINNSTPVILSIFRKALINRS